MEVHIYSVKAKGQAGNTRVKGIMTTQKAKAARYSNLAVWPLKVGITLLSGDRNGAVRAYCHIVTVGTVGCTWSPDIS